MFYSVDKTTFKKRFLNRNTSRNASNHIPDIYPTELHYLNNSNTSDKETSFLDFYIKVIGSDVHTSIYIKRDSFGFHIVNFPLVLVLRLLVGTPCAIGPELARVQTVRSIAYSSECRYIFCYTVFINIDVCGLHFYDHCTWVIGLYKEDYKHIFKCVFFWLHSFCSGKVGIPLTDLTTQIGWLSSLQLTVVNRSAIFVYWRFFSGVLLSRCFWEFSLDVRTFVIGLS